MEVRQHRLQYLFIEITRRCNLSCRHCGSDCTGQAGRNELTTASWIKLIDDIHQSFGPEVALVLAGGEPLLHPDFDELTAHIAWRRMWWGVVTNGQLLSAERLAAMQDSHVGAITVSLDGPQAAHDHLRNQPGAFEKTVAAMRLVGSAGIELSDVVTCVHPGNIDQLDATADIIIASGIRRWRLFRIFPSGRAGRDPSLNLDFEQTWRMLDWLKSNRRRLAKLGLSAGASCEGYLPFKIDRGVRDVPFFCRAGVNFGAILSDGTVTGCSNNDSSFHQGSVLDDNFHHIWESRFEDFRNRDWVARTDCGSCDQLGHCQGGSIHLWRLGDDRPSFCYHRPV